MRTRPRKLTLPSLAYAAAFGLLPGLPGPAAALPDGVWTARLEPPAAGGPARTATFRLVQDGARATLTLDGPDRTVTVDLPAAAAAFLLPLDGRSRLQDPWVVGGSRPAPAGPGWTLWDGRPAVVASAAPGVVRRVAADPDAGPLVEVDHGSGLVTRYRLSPHGRSAVPPGARVAAGDPVGFLGPGRPDDIPSVQFEVLLETGPGRWAVLDPAPVVFGSAANRALPIAGSALNAAVRGRNPAQVARLLGLGLDPDRKAVDGTCPLEWAVIVDDPALVRQLVAAGGDPGAATAERSGTYLEGVGMTIANHGPTIRDLARDSGDPDLAAAAGGDGAARNQD
jgi:hypothetical protein